MKWAELTSPELAEAAKTTGGVCVLPMGVYEKHGDHLPVGMDVFFSNTVAARAAEIEPAVVFPNHFYGQIVEGKHWPGAIAIKHDLMVALLENVCEEIARNGFKKILILNGHGGNEGFLALFSLRMLEKPRDYVVYIAALQHYLAPVLDDPEWKAQMVSPYDSHGGEFETSTMMAIDAALVKLQAMTPTGESQHRLSHLPARAPIWWYADFPNHYAGDATHATVEKGEFVMRGFVKKVAEIIAGVKADTEAARLQDEFYARVNH
jgi:creatinine amidohydrolase